MAVYQITKFYNGKKNVFVCEVESFSSTLSIPGDYLQISYSIVETIINKNTELPVFNVIYFNREGTKKNVYMCGSSFDDVFNYFRNSGDVSDFVTINNTGYYWYELR